MRLFLLTLFVLVSCDKKQVAPAEPPPPAASTPEEFHRRFRDAVIAGDGRTVWRFFSQSSRTFFTTGEGLKRFELTKARSDAELQDFCARVRLTPERLRAMTVEEYWVHMFGYPDPKSRERERVEKSRFDKAEPQGEKMLLTTKDSESGREQKWALVREEGGWRLDVQESDRLNSGK